MLKIYNSLTRKIEEFKPINPPNVGMYTCGMTVYDYAHIGHGRKYVGDDILRRVLEFNNYKVKHVQNITDVGHLTSDADEGEDKLEKSSQQTGKTVWEIAEFFTKHFYDSMKLLNVLPPHIIAKATDVIPEQINLVKTLIDKGYAYETPEAIYFDVTKFKSYGQIFGQSLKDKKVAVRKEVKTGSHKKNPADFSLWFKRVGRFKNHVMHWDSPWGDGFPGWHIECSAISIKYLGEQFDIHTGGEDHLSVHHPNEIAQAEAATGKSPFVKYWVHHAFLLVDNKKMSKSLKNFITVQDIVKKGFDPLSLRYFFLTAHYRKQQNFTWKALAGAQSSLENLNSIISDLKSAHLNERTALSEDKLEKIDQFKDKFVASINNDLNIPQALAVLWEVAKSNIPSPDKLDLLYLFDEVFALNLRQVNSKSAVTPQIQKLLDKRKSLRASGDFQRADQIRAEIESQNKVIIKDTPEGTVVKPAKNAQKN